ncbi:hypothetical protein ACFU6O_03820 [Streptomyces albidoflavus]
MDNAFDLDVWVNEARAEPFKFKLAGRVYTLPPAGELDKTILSEVNLTNPSARDIEILLRKGLDVQWKDFDATPAPIGALGELFRQWQRHEGASLGESSASADS